MSKNIILASLEHEDNYILQENGNTTKRYCKMCLGHEIHMTRYVIIDMLLQNKISTDDIIVTLKDRTFLYSKIFKNCITSDAFTMMEKDGYNIINLSYITGSDIPVREWSILQKYNHQVLKKFYTSEFKTLLNSIDYCETHYDCAKDYIVVHHRYNYDINMLIKTINKINSVVDVNIVIFNNNMSYIKKELENYKNLMFVDNLQLYASYLNNPKCKLFISEWSGGGQLSHYCYDGKIIYYFHQYHDIHYVGKEKEFAKLSMETDMFQHWDFKHSRNIDINMFCTLDDLLENLQ
jgi:hypothetical protein